MHACSQFEKVFDSLRLAVMTGGSSADATGGCVLFRSGLLSISSVVATHIMAVDYRCLRCGLAAILQDSHPTGGKSIQSREHKACGTVRRSMPELCNHHPGLKHWFKTAPDSEKKDWYLRQREKTGSAGKRRDWDDCGLEHLVEKGTRQSKAEQVQWDNFGMYSDRRLQKVFAMYGGTGYKKAMAHFEDELKKLSADPDIGSEKIGSHWCVPRFNGMMQSARPMRTTSRPSSGSAPSVIMTRSSEC